jgi:hypothetical protein
LCLWEHPYISIESELFAFGGEKGYFLTRPDGDVYIIDYGLSLAPRPDGIVRIATPETSWNARVAIIDLTNQSRRLYLVSGFAPSSAANGRGCVQNRFRRRHSA